MLQARKYSAFCCVFGKQFVPLHKDLNDMAQSIQFEVTFMDEASEFLRTLADAPREKIYYNLRKVRSGLIDSDLFKKLEGGSDIWEFRTLYNGIQYRLLAFWDEQEKRLVVATHGFVKKTWKVPQQEIARAEALRKKYYESK